MTLRRIDDSPGTPDWRAGGAVSTPRAERSSNGRRHPEGEPTRVRGVRVVRLEDYFLFYNEDGDVAEISRKALQR